MPLWYERREKDYRTSLWLDEAMALLSNWKNA